MDVPSINFLTLAGGLLVNTGVVYGMFLGWKRAVNGDLRKIREETKEIRGAVGEVDEKVETVARAVADIHGFCQGRNAGGGDGCHSLPRVLTF